jgi:hypothetical protein
MATHHFSLNILEGDTSNDETLNALYEAGCSDATFGSTEGQHHARFAREHASLGAAIQSAMDQINSVPGVRCSTVAYDIETDID